MMSIATRLIVLLIGIVLMGYGVWIWLSEGYMGLWSSIGITLGFSFLVVGVDEWMHAVRHARHPGGPVVTATH